MPAEERRQRGEAGVVVLFRPLLADARQVGPDRAAAAVDDVAGAAALLLDQLLPAVDVGGALDLAVEPVAEVAAELQERERVAGLRTADRYLEDIWGEKAVV